MFTEQSYIAILATPTIRSLIFNCAHRQVVNVVVCEIHARNKLFGAVYNMETNNIKCYFVSTIRCCISLYLCLSDVRRGGYV